MRCALCAEPLTFRYFSKIWNDPHYKAYHAEYSEWVGGWLKIFVIVGTIDALALGIVLYLFRNPWTFVVAIWPYIVPLWILMMLYLQRTSRFKREWKEQHPSLTQP